MGEEISNEEVAKVPVIGKFKTKRTYLNFVSAVSGARVRFIRETAFLKGEKLSGMLENVVFKITICDERTVNFEEVDTNQCDEAMIKRLLDEIENLEPTGYAQNYVVSELQFTDEEGSLCYLAVEEKKPYDKLKGLFDEEEAPKISQKGLSLLDQLFAEEEEEEEEYNIDISDHDGIGDAVDNLNEDLEDKPVKSYLEEQFEKMNEEKVNELKKRVQDSHVDISKYNQDIKFAESKLSEVTQKLDVIQTRLESMTDGDAPNGFAFHVSEEQKLETGLDETTRSIADKIADIMKLKKKVLFDYLTGSFYIIRISDKNDFTKKADKETLSKVLSIDPSGNFSMNDEGNVEYRGNLNWHQLTAKMIRNGFEQIEEFDKAVGSNSYDKEVEQIVEQIDKVEDTKDEVEFDVKTLFEYDTPTDLVVLGMDFNGRDIEITDDYSTLGIYINGSEHKSIETEGHVNIMNIASYKKWLAYCTSPSGAIDENSGIEAILLPGFIGKIEIGAKVFDEETDEFRFSSDFDENDYIQHQFSNNEYAEVFINLPENTEIVKITSFSDFNKLVPYLRNTKIDSIIN